MHFNCLNHKVLTFKLCVTMQYLILWYLTVLFLTCSQL